jgi:carbohydrate-selective porin OprB
MVTTGSFTPSKEAFRTIKPHGKLAVGGWYRTTDFESEFSGRAYSDNFGLYLIGETDLTDHWAGFFQLGNADKDRNQIGLYAGAGVVYSALMTEDDLVGVGMAYARSSDEYANLNPKADEFETALECTYTFCPNPWLTLQAGPAVHKRPRY